MKILLDTHILLWALANDRRLPDKARQMIEDRENEVFYSIVSPWEVEIKRLLHPDRLQINAEDIVHYCTEAGYHCLGITDKHVFCLKHLKRSDKAPLHKDPFDRILICQAVTDNMMFLTHDRLLAAYNEPVICTV